MGLDLDKYYTPAQVAYEALERVTLERAPIVCGDTACGAGQLLVAAKDVLGSRHFLGIDKDKAAISKLRKAHPDWKLYSGDFLRRKKAPELSFKGESVNMDLLVLNPPFSLGGCKSVEAEYLGQPVKCSVAMAHILRSLHLFKPTQGIVAVVPESLLHSDTDAKARALLASEFMMNELLRLDIYTFKGARVNSSIIQLRVGQPSFKNMERIFPAGALEVTVVRGGAPIHSSPITSTGVPLVHSTSLRGLARDGMSTLTRLTNTVAKGRVRGWVILLPRVGSPCTTLCRAVYLRSEVQLSDCVIAVCFSNKDHARAAENLLRSNWTELLEIYKGTAARYVTIARLSSYLQRVGLVPLDRAGRPSG